MNKLSLTNPDSQPINNKGKDKETSYTSKKPTTQEIKCNCINNKDNPAYKSKPVSKLFLPIHLLSLAVYNNTVQTVHILKRIIGWLK